MHIIERSGRFNKWYARLTDKQAQARITLRIKRAAEGNFGVTRPVGEGVHEMKIDYGPGYRLYYARKGETTTFCCAAATSQANKAISRLQLHSGAHCKSKIQAGF